VAKANTLMKGELIVKKTAYFCVLGYSKLFYSISEIEEHQKGEYSVCSPPPPPFKPTS
jgi:hypothetical protein